LLYCEEDSTLTDLHYEPVNLIDSPFFSIPRVASDLFTDMPGFVIKLSAYHAITQPAASLLENDTSSTNDLNSIHEEALDNSKLTIYYLINRAAVPTPSRGHSRFGNEDNLYLLSIWPAHFKPSLIS